jgi:hypothetical protein
MVVIGLALTATAAGAEPLRLAETDLDRVTVDVQNSRVVTRVVELIDDDDIETDDNVIRILSDTEIALLDIRRTTDPENDDGDHAVIVGNGRPDAASISEVRVSDADMDADMRDGSDGVILGYDDLAGVAVFVVDRDVVARNDASGAGTSAVSR